MSEFEDHVDMFRILRKRLKPVMEIKGRGIGNPLAHKLYRPDAWWQIGQNWYAVEVETDPFRNKLERKAVKAAEALEDVKEGWEPSTGKNQLSPLLSKIRRAGLRMVLGIPSVKGEYLRSEQFSRAIRKSKELDVKVEVYLIDQPSKDAWRTTLLNR
jgi:hypothetical protein